MKADIVIVGSGVAGLYCALNLPKEKSIIIVTKNKARRRDTYHKAGRCPLAFLLIGLDARMNCSKIKI